MTGDLELTAAELREAFDASFAAEATTEVEATVELLVVAIGDRRVAIAAEEIGAVLRCPALTAIPSDNPALRGLANVRGALVAVSSLGALLEVEPGEPARGRWVVLWRDDRSVGLQLDDIAGYVRVAAGRIRSAAGEQVVELGGAVVPIVVLRQLLEPDRAAAAGAGRRK